MVMTSDLLDSEIKKKMHVERMDERRLMKPMLHASVSRCVEGKTRSYLSCVHSAVYVCEGNIKQTDRLTIVFILLVWMLTMPVQLQAHYDI